MSAHTPLPWVVRVGPCKHDHPDTSANVEDQDGFPIANTWCHGWAKANAAFIVKACNVHPALVEALEEIASFEGADPEFERSEARRIARSALALVSK